MAQKCIDSPLRSEDIPADYLVASNDRLVKGIKYNFDPELSEDPGDFYNYAINHGFLNNSFSFMMTKNNEALRDEFNTAIASMKEDGTLDRLIKLHKCLVT